MINVINEGRSSRINGTSLSGYIHNDYNTLVRLFGEPMTGKDTDEYKVDAEWHIQLEDAEEGFDWFVSIYNYKDGKNYLGANGLNVEDITEWHIGSKSTEDYHVILDYISDRLEK